MQARKASQRDWLVLTHHETGQEKAGRGHTNSGTTKGGSGCVNKVNSQAERGEQRSVYLANAPESTVCHDVYIVDTFPQLKFRPGY